MTKACKHFSPIALIPLTLAQQLVARFEAMVQPVNSYKLALSPNSASALRWNTQEGEAAIEYVTEPARSNWQRMKVNILTLLSVDDEL